MSQLRALVEIERFLSSKDPEVLSISGRWGVGKTHAWDDTLKAKRATTPLRRYAYVSAFGLRSLDALKTAIVQSTVRLEGNELEPTVESFIEHVSSFAGLRKLGEEATRKSIKIFSKGAAAIPYAGKMADLLAPGAALLIRNQIICIDDIERAGQGLDVTDILGLVSSLRERRHCKVVLLLNEDGLGDQGTKYREYLEKVVDQAVKFEPTPQESAAAALDAKDTLGSRLRAKTEALGITNIRVIRRIRRFLSYIEPQLTGLHHGVTEGVVHSIALLGWCVFEPKLAPDVDRVRRFDRFSGLFSEDKRSIEDKRVDQFLQTYGFGVFDDVDSIILDGLNAGAFDTAALRAALEAMHRGLDKDDVRLAIAKPWKILGESFDDNAEEFLDALVESIEKHADAMTPSEASDALVFLRELGRPEEADRLLPVYVGAQDGKPREFFASRHDSYRRSVDKDISAAFQQKLATMPLIRDPAGILLDIGSKNGWNPADVAYLATVSVDEYEAMLKKLHGADLQAVISVALRFGESHGTDANDREVCIRMTEALRRIADQGSLNRIRIKPYLKEALEVGDPEQADTNAGTDGSVDTGMS
jgi:hypothetical protein